MHPVQRLVLPRVDFEDDLVGAVSQVLLLPTDEDGTTEPSGRIAETSTARRRAGRGSPAMRRCHLAQVHVEILDRTAVDLFAHQRVGVVGQAEVDTLGPSQRAVQFGPVEAPVQTLIA
jgi:hypothetical protein